MPSSGTPPAPFSSHFPSVNSCDLSDLPLSFCKSFFQAGPAGRASHRCWCGSPASRGARPFPYKTGDVPGIPAPRSVLGCRDLGARWLNRRINPDIKQNRGYFQQLQKEFRREGVRVEASNTSCKSVHCFFSVQITRYGKHKCCTQKNHAVPHFHRVVDGYRVMPRARRCLPGKAALLHGEPYWSNWELDVLLPCAQPHGVRCPG